MFANGQETKSVGRRYKYKLSKLRDFGWEIWDPIGLKNDRANCEDEYDSYLLQVLSKLTQNVSRLEIVEYLTKVESENMGLGIDPTTRSRTEKLIVAITEYQGTL